MVVRKSFLMQRAERGPGSRSRQDVASSAGPKSTLGAATLSVLTGLVKDGHRRPGRELEDLPLPDLLSPLGGPGPDPEPLINLLDLAFLGRASAGELDRELDRMDAGTTRWEASHFAGDLFLSELIGKCLSVEVRGHRLPAHSGFLERVLCNPPADITTVRFRQAIIRELESDRGLRNETEELLVEIFDLLKLLRASRDDARLEPVRFRLDVLGAFRIAVERMGDAFSEASSGLIRLHSFAEELGRSTAFTRMTELLDHQAKMAALQLDAVVGADGRLRHLEIKGLKECKGNLFYRRPLRRWWDRLRIFYHRYNMSANDLVDRLVMGVYHEVAPALARVIQLLCHLEVYQATRCFAADAEQRGLDVCLPEVVEDGSPVLEGLFNPLLLPMMEHPIPSDLDLGSATAIALVTGPNSGGKTRLLQAVGIAQVLTQSGLYAPCAEARIPLVHGLFASLVENDRADQAEGRLGTELMRLRTLFETVPPGSLVLLDELCSGTNPSEAIEIVEMVLRLLGKIEPVAFVTTHFLDFAQQLHTTQSAKGLVFLQAEVHPERGATFRFIPGVAETSLAVGTARRLGLTLEELEDRLKGGSEPGEGG